jgi:proteasome lid subunit RPN8/RPN11
LSGDDIQFGDISFREPVPMRRPDRDRRFTCMAYETPRPDDLPIFLDLRPADAIERHALRDTSVELGGILLGRECVDDVTGEPFVWVTEAIEAKHYENTQASFTYTHDSWQEITRERDARFPDLDIVGWYHTHPDFGIFLSGHDLFIHRNFFDQPLQVAYVVDPIRQTRGFFRWKSGGLDQVGGYYLVTDRQDRAKLARFVNDLENIPNAESSGGGFGLSPRLEAELVAMLSRPAYQPQQSYQDRAQTAAISSMAGLIAGLLILGAVLWINSLNQQIREQAERIEGLSTNVKGNNDIQRMAIHALGVKTSKNNDGSDLFTEAYKKALIERDATESKNVKLSYVNDQLAVDGKAMFDELVTLKKDLSKADSIAKEYVSDAKETKKLRAENEKLRTAMGEKADLLDAADATKAAAIIQKSKWYLWLAIAGWGIAAVMTGFILYLWTFGSQPQTNEADASQPPTNSPPHVIM